MTTRPFRSIGVAVVAMTMLPACRGGLQFAGNQHVRITTPRENADVTLPFRMDWRDDRRGERFAVFFDAPPMSPGRTLLSLVPKADPCRARAGCPDADWLGKHYVYLTTESHIEVNSLADLRSGHLSQEAHQVVVVLIDPSGRRIGEDSFLRDFNVKREG